MTKSPLAQPLIRYGFTILVALVSAWVFSQLSIAQGKTLANAVPWGILVLTLTAWLGMNKGDALRLGAVFGFLVSYAYLWFDNRNIHSLGQVLLLIVLIVLPALFGLLCGITLGYLGWRIRLLFIRKNR